MFQKRVCLHFSIYFALLVAFLVAPAEARAADYRFITIDVPGSADTEIYGINNNGLVSGLTYDENGTAHGLIWKNGVTTIVDAPGQGPVGLFLYQNNNSGQVAGGYYDVNGISHAVIYDSAKNRFQSLPDIPGTIFNAAGGITNSGVTSGNFTTDPTLSFDYIAWLFSGGVYYPFVAPDSDQTLLGTITYSMNDSLQIVGYYFDVNGVTHGFLKPRSAPAIAIDVPFADNTGAYGINNAGTIVGRYRINGGPRHGFLLSKGNITTVDYPGAVHTWITTINDRGDLGGFYEDADGNFHGWIGLTKGH
jgi:uncharacterized membrane protein